VQLVRHPQPKERVTDRLYLNHRATSRLYPFGNEPFGLIFSVGWAAKLLSLYASQNGGHIVFAADS
jgi:hypothetical protein